MPKSRRKHRTSAEIQKILSAYLRSGLSQERFCSENRVPFSSFHRWLSKSRKTEKTTLPAIIPVGSVPNSISPIEIEMPGGHIIRLHSSVNPSDLKTVLGALKRC